MRIEVMGDLVIACPDGAIDIRDHWPYWDEHVRVCKIEGLHIPVIPLEWQVIANMLLRRPERVRPIVELLLARGFDRSFLESLLKDERLSMRAVTNVREVMRLDA